MPRIAAAAYACEFLGAWSAYEAKIARWVADAAGQGAELLVFPEWAGLELATFDGRETAAGAESCIDAQTRWLPQADALHARLAAENGVHICAASALVRREDGQAVNRARLFAPSGAIGVQDKLVMTRYEREVLDIRPGDQARVFDTALGRIAIAICYDAEFPLIARAMVEAGAQIILAPSCTEGLQGYWRVRIGAQARAMEGQCITVQSPTVGRADWNEAIDVTTGAAGIFCPPDRGFPPTGILALGQIDAPGWVLADADLGAVAGVRRDGGVLNMTHWPEQQDGRLSRLETVDLRTGAARSTAAE
ncbi:MAG TPA: carbon-nitrogen hydrolase family protein [Thermohalobaculum sp.]|nr:carbon-nitrogen hydrolase family protein [Thermohalobaculum sp.]